MHRGSLAPGDWIQLNGPFNLLNISSVTFRVADAAAGRTAGSPLAAIEVHQDSLTGPIVHDLQPGLDRRHGRLDEPDVPDLARRAHTSCSSCSGRYRRRTGNNLFNLNWAEFVGSGIGQP